MHAWKQWNLQWAESSCSGVLHYKHWAPLSTFRKEGVAQAQDQLSWNASACSVVQHGFCCAGGKWLGAGILPLLILICRKVRFWKLLRPTLKLGLERLHNEKLIPGVKSMGEKKTVEAPSHRSGQIIQERWRITILNQVPQEAEMLTATLLVGHFLCV